MLNAKILPFEAIGKKTVTNEQEVIQPPQMLTIKQVTALTGLSYTFLRNLCMEKKIVHTRAGKKYLINYDRFVDYLNGVERT